MRLPQTILTYPMTLASQLAHLVMKVQQDLADFVIKGDSTLETLFPPKDELPEWATFDEDEPDAAAPEHNGAPVARMTEGRFALYSEPGATDTDAGPRHAATGTLTVPEVAVEIDYDALTLAQLRARLQSLSVGQLEDLLSYEETGKARAPFQTLLANRITRASAK